MRLRSLVVPAALAVVASVAVPATASAAVPGCHLSGPAKVVVDSAFEKVTWGFGPDCMDVTNGGGATATWDLRDPSGDVATTIGLEIPDPMAHEYSYTFGDLTPKGRYTTTPTGITPSWLTQNSPDLLVKYASGTTLSPSRGSDGSLTLTARATSWSGMFSDWYPRGGVQVQLQRRYPGEREWTWLKNATSSAGGRATFRLLDPRAGEYRARVVESTSIWGSASSTYRVP